MKNIIHKTAAVLLGSLVGFQSCSKFEEINKDPYGANADQVQVEYFINNAIINSQMDPHIAERVFVLYWTTAGRFSSGGGISSGGYNDGWSSDYYGRSYMASWLSAINSAIQIGQQQIEAGTAPEYTPNLVQVARIWRAYLMSELADTFGPIPLDAFHGDNPSYASLQDVYNFLLSELTDASTKLDLAVSASSISRFDPAYGYDFAKWQKYANSMRMRLAMRLSEVDAGKAQAEFEAAAALPHITAAADMFQVAEQPGWDGLTGVMTRTWNHFNISATLNNLYLGLGGIPSADQLATSYADYIKPANYVGIKYDDHFAMLTNAPTAGYWFDGLPNSIDPRAYKIYAIPGDESNALYPTYATLDNKRNLMSEDGSVFKEVNLAYTWNGFANGAWGTRGSLNQVYSYPNGSPRLNSLFRNSDNKRVFFAPWESYFLVAEAALRGWSAPMDAQAAYEAGITSSFEHWGVTSYLGDYLSSTDYNMTGTSVSWGHTTEPPATHAMNFVDGYTGSAGVANIPYPDNDLYEGGAVKNDLLTKIITQKFIAQAPWLPLETWNDQRRLGLPFFENPAVEDPLVNMPDLNQSNYMDASIRFFPQRVRYPSTIPASNPEGYDSAVSALGGPDEVLTPLWWAKQQ
ncbi:SusD/RagB family nutrient-binding outer membrane lipoprotein [Parapedobacter lycopersici]|uniref:SusD/RagB family nutrient-binding outer membrane lipoprotein n=1 Tax=Parapedobacter lycopersici TaxID=1864939 RepID=UPI00214DB6EE|nr:SusD/RagB family nutrient-binding outer membrane lipoprotein [Parapedobacter lycopersici]